MTEQAIDSIVGIKRSNSPVISQSGLAPRVSLTSDMVRENGSTTTRGSNSTKSNMPKTYMNPGLAPKRGVRKSRSETSLGSAAESYHWCMYGKSTPDTLSSHGSHKSPPSMISEPRRSMLVRNYNLAVGVNSESNGSNLSIGTGNVSAPAYSDAHDFARGPTPRSPDIERDAGAVRDYKEESSGSNDAAKKEPLFDRMSTNIKDGFESVRAILGLIAFVVGLLAFIVMIVLVSYYGRKGNKQHAKCAFSIFGTIVVVCSGVVTAATNASRGEVSIIMTFVLVLGIFISNQLDDLMNIHGTLMKVDSDGLLEST